MDLYTAERLVLERQRHMEVSAERRARHLAGRESGARSRVWMARRLRALADRLDGRPQLQRV